MAYASLIDVHELIHACISANATFVAAATGGIYGPPGLPLGWTPASGKTLTFLEGGFQGDNEKTVAETSYRISCYGIDDVDARSLYNIFYTQFHRKGKRKIAITGGNGLVIWSAQLSGPMNVTDPVTGWVYTMATWIWTVSENLVT